MRKFGLIQNGFRDSWCLDKRVDVRHFVHYGEFTTMSAEEFAEQEMYCGIIKLSAANEAQIKQFLANVIPTKAPEIGRTTLVKHKIHVQGHPPVKCTLSSIACGTKGYVRRGGSSPSEKLYRTIKNSECSSPIVMVKNSNDTYRMCVIFDKLRSAHYISTINLSLAYHKVPLKDNSRSLPGRGLFQYKRMPVGLSGVPATFQLSFDKLVGPEMHPHSFAYVDAISRCD